VVSLVRFLDTSYGLQLGILPLRSVSLAPLQSIPMVLRVLVRASIHGIPMGPLRLSLHDLSLVLVKTHPNRPDQEARHRLKISYVSATTSIINVAT